MDTNQRLENTILRIIDYIIVILIILGTQSVLDRLATSDLHIPILLGMFLIFRIITLISNINKNIINILLFSVVWITYIGIYALYTPGKTAQLVQLFIIVFLLLLIYFSLFQNKHNLNELIRMYSNVIFIIACISMIFWIFGSVLGTIKPSGNIQIQWGNSISVSNYYYLYYQWQNDAQILGHVFFRNIGIFCEAPMFGLNLSVAFLGDFLINNRRSFRRTLLYFITSLSTISVTAILLVLMVFILDKFGGYVSEVIEHNKVNVGLLIFPFLAVVVIVVGYGLLSNKLSSASGSSRLEDYISGYRAWQLHTFIGNGFGDISARVSFSSYWRLARSETGYTNSVMTVLSEGGIYFFLSYMIAFIHFLKKAVKMHNYRLGIFVIMWCYLFFTTTFAHTMLMLCFMAYAYTEMINNKKAIN